MLSRRISTRLKYGAILMLLALMKPTVVMGQASGMQGDASWNEYRFRGQLTASGERYDPESLTAASHDLPFDSLVRVTRVDNGKTVVVRINDRTSPDEHIIHLSDAAGRHIGVSPNDTQLIRLEILEGDKLTVVRRPEETLRERERDEQRARDEERRAEENRFRTENEKTISREDSGTSPRTKQAERPRPKNQRAEAEVRNSVQAEPEKKLTLQLGVFSTKRAARNFSGDVKGSWVAPVTVKGREQFRVYYSRFHEEAEARIAQKKLKSAGHDSFLRKL